MSRSTMFKASGIIGDRIFNSAGEPLGKIEDLVIDPNTGSVSYVIVSFDRFGDRLHAIPLSSLRSSLSGDHLVFAGDPSQIDRAAAFDRRDWPDMTNPAWRESVRGYYPVDSPRVVRERVIERETPRRPVSVFGAILGVLLLALLLGFGYLVATRGWDNAKITATNWVQGVVYAAKETSEDAALTGKVKAALSLSRRVPASNINVDTQNKVVALKGEVPDEETRGLVETIARDTPGVTEVRDELTVNPTSVAQAETQAMRGRVADLEEKYLVHEAIVKHPALIGEDIEVSVKDHAVTLTGSVDSADQKYVAEQVASSVDGIRSVNNQLRVTYPSN